MTLVMNSLTLGSESTFTHYKMILQENIPVEEVFQILKCSKEGLTTGEGQKRIEIFGPNKLEEKKVRLSFFTTY